MVQRKFPRVSELPTSGGQWRCAKCRNWMNFLFAWTHKCGPLCEHCGHAAHPRGDCWLRHQPDSNGCKCQPLMYYI